MTSFAFILGCLPLWFASGSGGVSRKTLGTVVIGGMLGATCVDIFIVPVTFSVVEQLAARFSRNPGKNTPATTVRNRSIRWSEDCRAWTEVRAFNRQTTPKAVLMISPERNDRQREIVAIAAFVARLEVIPVDGQNRAVGQIAEGAEDRRRGGVADHGQDEALLQCALRGPWKTRSLRCSWSSIGHPCRCALCFALL